MHFALKTKLAVALVLAAFGVAPASAADLCAQGRIVKPKINGRPSYQFAGMPHVAFQQKSCAADGACVYDILKRSGSSFSAFWNDVVIEDFCNAFSEKKEAAQRRSDLEPGIPGEFDFSQGHSFSGYAKSDRGKLKLIISSTFYSSLPGNAVGNITFHGPGNDGGGFDPAVQIYGFAHIIEY